MTITLVCGSVAKKSHTFALLKYIESLLNKKRVKTIFWDLKEKPLRIAIPEFHSDPMKTPDKNVQEFIQTMEKSDGVVLGSPLYHGSYSGVLKNALDNLYYDIFRNKPVALVSNGSSLRNSAHPCEHLRLVVRAMFGYVLQSQIGTGKPDYEEKPDKFELVNEEIKQRCERMTHELMTFAELLKKHPINDEG